MMITIFSCKEKNETNQQLINNSDYSGNYVTNSYAQRKEGFDWVSVAIKQINKDEIKVSVRSRIDIKKPSCTFDTIAKKVTETTYKSVIDGKTILFEFKEDLLSISTKNVEDKFILMYYCSGGGSLMGDYKKINEDLDQTQIDKTSFSVIPNESKSTEDN